MSAKLNELRSDIDELNELVKQSKRKRVQDILSLEIRKLETEWVSLKDKEEKAQQPGATAEAAASSSVIAPKRYRTKINGYGWDQSEKYVKVFVTLKNVHTIPKENIYCKLTERCMELHVDDLEGKDFILVINKLLEPIIVQDCHWKQKTDMVVIFLLKSNPNIKWSHMTEMDKKSDDQHKNRFKPDEDMMNKKDPQESIMGLMKNMNNVKMADKPKRPLSAYMLWLNSARESIKSENPGLKVTEIAKKGGEIWRGMKDKSVWEEKAARAKEQYIKDPESFNANGGSEQYETGDDEMKRMISKAWYEGQHKKKSDTVEF